MFDWLIISSIYLFNKKGMIDSIFASEFDLMKGCVVRAHEPSGLSFDEVILAAYMLPDGV